MGRNDNSPREQEQRERLLRTFLEPSLLSVEEAEALLPELVYAEMSGEDIDADPTLASVRAHMQTCEACETAYTQLVADLEFLQHAPHPMPAPTVLPPVFHEPLEYTLAAGILRVWQGAKRMFELRFPPPQPAPKIPVMAASETLFGDELEDVPGQPFVSATAHGLDDEVEWRIAVDDHGARSRWTVRVAWNDNVMQQQVDEDGVAVLRMPAAQSQGPVVITWTEDA